MISMGTRIRAYNGVLDVLRQGNLGALLVPVLLLMAGWGARTALSRKTVKYSWRGMTLTHPAGWAVVESHAEDGGDDSVVLMNLLGPGRIKPRLTLRVATLVPDGSGSEAGDDRAEHPPASAPPAQPPPSAPAAVGTSAATRGEDHLELRDAAPTSHLPLYYEMGEEPVQLGTYAATRVDSAFAFTPKAAAGRRRDIPVVMRAIDLVVMRGGDALSAQVAAPIEEFETLRPNLETIIASLQVEPMPAAAAPAVEPMPSGPAIPSGAVSATGQVVDAQSGLPVPGAIVLFLTPGTSVSDVDDDNLARVAYTTGMADSTGLFTTNRLLARSAHYGVIVVADGYRWIGTDDAVALGADAPAMLDMGTIPLRRP